ncbi:MAG TPA: DUF427 domain-containing protein [Pseudonocardia sp.]|nr:DUF427 domain-containing protein [Pseudonocardia sp.]
MRDYPRMIVSAGHVEPVPRRIRALLGGSVVLDTTEARYVWEWPNYPQYYVPLADVAPGALVDEGHTERVRGTTAHRHGLRVGELTRPGAALVYPADGAAPEAGRSGGAEGPTGRRDSLTGLVRFDWGALDSWFEEDEEVFVHPRNPYTRVDALRSRRHVLVERDGVRLAESDSTVLVFETGLPTRYYFDRTAVNLAALEPSDTVTACPYKGLTSAYWSVVVGGNRYPDLAWAYDFPTRELLPITGLVAFYNERVDIVLDGVRLPRARTHFFPVEHGE